MLWLVFLICIVSLFRILNCLSVCCIESHNTFLNCLWKKLSFLSICIQIVCQVEIVSPFPYLQTKHQLLNCLFSSWHHTKTYNLPFLEFWFFLLFLSDKNI